MFCKVCPIRTLMSHESELGGPWGYNLARQGTPWPILYVV